MDLYTNSRYNDIETWKLHYKQIVEDIQNMSIKEILPIIDLLYNHIDINTQNMVEDRIKNNLMWRLNKISTNLGVIPELQEDVSESRWMSWQEEFKDRLHGLIYNVEKTSNYELTALIDGLVGNCADNLIDIVRLKKKNFLHFLNNLDSRAVVESGLVINTLISLADRLDVKGLVSAANMVDIIISKYAKNNNYSDSKLIKTANQKSVLMNKLFLSEQVADFFIEYAGKLSIWYANQKIQSFAQNSGGKTIKEMAKVINNAFSSNGGIAQQLRTQMRAELTDILDWSRHPLNEGTINLRDMTIKDALEQSRIFHDNLKASGGDINYVEKNPIFKSYGDGFYWAHIHDSSSSKEEGERMGHCGRSGSADILFSLREVKPYGKENTINESHVTVAYNTSNGKVYQSKGKKNQKPSPKYFPYIYDLIISLSKFSGFGTEYASSQDYGFSDMTDEQIKTLFDKNKKMFSNLIPIKAELMERKLIPNDPSLYIIKSHLRPNEIFYYITPDFGDFNDLELTYDNILNIIEPENKKHLNNYIEKYNVNPIQFLINTYNRVKLRVATILAYNKRYIADSISKSILSFMVMAYKNKIIDALLDCDKMKFLDVKINNLDENGVYFEYSLAPYIKEYGINAIDEIDVSRPDSFLVLPFQSYTKKTTAKLEGFDLILARKFLNEDIKYLGTL